MMPRVLKRNFRWVGLLATVFVVAGFAMWRGGGGDVEAATKADNVEQTASAQIASFAILRRAATKEDAVPADKTAELGSLASDGAELDQAKAFDTLFGRGWVVPAPSRDRLCLVIPDKVDGFGITCQSTRDALAGRLVGSMVSGPGQPPDGEVVGVVPDGSDVTLTSGTAGPEQLVIRESVVVARSSSRGTLAVTTAVASAQFQTGPEPEGRLFQECPDGRVVELSAPSDEASEC